MNSTERRKREKIGNMSTEAIERILGSLAGPEKLKPSPAHPLGGKVNISRMGFVPVLWLREELEGRKKS